MKLVTATCPRCSFSFALAQEVFDEMNSLTCPRCEQPFIDMGEDEEDQVGTGENGPMDEDNNRSAGESEELWDNEQDDAEDEDEIDGEDDQGQVPPPNPGRRPRRTA